MPSTFDRAANYFGLPETGGPSLESYFGPADPQQARIARYLNAGGQPTEAPPVEHGWTPDDLHAAILGGDPQGVMSLVEATKAMRQKEGFLSGLGEVPWGEAGANSAVSKLISKFPLAAVDPHVQGALRLQEQYSAKTSPHITDPDLLREWHKARGTTPSPDEAALLDAHDRLNDRNTAVQLVQSGIPVDQHASLMDGGKFDKLKVAQALQDRTAPAFKDPGELEDYLKSTGQAPTKQQAALINAEKSRQDEQTALKLIQSNIPITEHDTYKLPNGHYDPYKVQQAMQESAIPATKDVDTLEALYAKSGRPIPKNIRDLIDTEKEISGHKRYLTWKAQVGDSPLLAPYDAVQSIPELDEARIRGKIASASKQQLGKDDKKMLGDLVNRAVEIPPNVSEDAVRTKAIADNQLKGLFTTTEPTSGQLAVAKAALLRPRNDAIEAINHLHQQGFDVGLYADHLGIPLVDSGTVRGGKGAHAPVTPLSGENAISLQPPPLLRYQPPVLSQTRVDRTPPPVAPTGPPINPNLTIQEQRDQAERNQSEIDNHAVNSEWTNAKGNLHSFLSKRVPKDKLEQFYRTIAAGGVGEHHGDPKKQLLKLAGVDPDAYYPASKFGIRSTGWYGEEKSISDLLDALAEDVNASGRKGDNTTAQGTVPSGVPWTAGAPIPIRK